MGIIRKEKVSKKGKADKSKGISATDFRIMELRYSSLSYDQIYLKINEEAKNPDSGIVPIGYETIRIALNPGGKLYHEFNNYCESINTFKLEMAKKSFGSLVEKAVRAIGNAMDLGDTKLAERFLEQVGILDKQSISSMGSGTTVWERFIHQNNESLNGPEEVKTIEAAGEVIDQESE